MEKPLCIVSVAQCIELYEAKHQTTAVHINRFNKPPFVINMSKHSR